MSAAAAAALMCFLTMSAPGGAVLTYASTQVRRETCIPCHIRVSHVQVSDLQCLKTKVSHRRPHSRSRDGPFPLEHGEVSTRAREFDALSRQCGQGGCEVGPGHYDGAAAKDTCLRGVYTGARIGSSCREPTKQHVRCPSVSKSLAGMNAPSEPTAIHCPRHGENRGAAPMPMLLPQSAGNSHTGRQVSTPTTVNIGNAPHCSEPSAVADICPNRQDREVKRSVKQECLARHQQRMTRKSTFRQQCHIRCPAVLSAEAAKCRQPGSWNWNAVAQPLCNTFTKQDGGWHNNPRTQTPAEYVPPDASTGHHQSGIRPRNLVSGHIGVCGTSNLRKNASQQVMETSVRTDDGNGLVSITALISQHELHSHQLAAEAAAAALAVDLRQKQWQLQSALLPFMKQGMTDQSKIVPALLRS